MNCQVLVYNSKLRESVWIDGVITGTTAGDVGEEFLRINVVANGVNYLGCHPNCVRVNG